MRGYLFEKFAESNPLGIWMKMKAAELGLTNHDLADKAGITGAALAQMFNPNLSGPSFTTTTGGILIDAIAAEEKEQWRALWGRHGWGVISLAGDDPAPQRYPSSRPRVLRQAAFALSLWNKPQGPARLNNLQFFELLPMLSGEVYSEAVAMLCEPYYGLIETKRSHQPRKPLPGPVHKYHDRFPSPRRTLRKTYIDLLLRAEADDQREDIFDKTFDDLISAGNRPAAFQRAVERVEGLLEQRHDLEMLHELAMREVEEREHKDAIEA